MADITEIMDMLDWNMPPEMQSKGVSLAKNAGTIIPFIQPLTPKHNKNVWENCAVIIAEKSDEELKPHLSELLEWLQDMNWPGAFCILDRLQKYSDNDSICNAIRACIEKAKNCGDEAWESNLRLLLHKKQSRQEKRQIYRSSLLAVLGGLLIIALICAAFVLPTIRHNLECSHFPDGGTWVCDDLNLSINFDEYTAVFQSGQQTVTCEMIREFNSNYIVLENGATYGALFSGECVDLSDTVLKIEESKTERIYLFRKAESH